MKNQVNRTIILLAVACVLFWIEYFFANPGNKDMMNIVRGATAGFGLAGCVSFLILIYNQIKQNRA